MICKECPIKLKCYHSTVDTKVYAFYEEPCELGCKHKNINGCKEYCTDEECKYEPYLKDYRTINLAMKNNKKTSH